MTKMHEQALMSERNERTLRQKRFALVLTGDDGEAQRLLDQMQSRDEGAPQDHVTPSVRQYYLFKRLYELWMGESQRLFKGASLFEPGRENEAIEKGLDPSIARAMGELPTMHRALLLLIYGESFSYAATAQLLNITIEELMNALAVARSKFREPRTMAPMVSPGVLAGSSDREVAHDATQ